jgi:hypothetical protein
VATVLIDDDAVIAGPFEFGLNGGRSVALPKAARPLDADAFGTEIAGQRFKPLFQGHGSRMLAGQIATDAYRRRRSGFQTEMGKETDDFMNAM